MANLATRKLVLREIEKIEETSVDDYLKEARFQKPRGVHLVYAGRLYPARAIWAQARPEPLGQYDNASMYCKPDAFHRLSPEFRLTTVENHNEYLSSISAIEDFQSSDYYNEDPQYILIISNRFVRKERIRKKVLSRANGRCELGLDCNVFKTRDGRPYLETHHILALSCKGPDTLDNVIALCPSHHRECHFGENWQELQAKCLAVISSKL